MGDHPIERINILNDLIFSLNYGMKFATEKYYL